MLAFDCLAPRDRQAGNSHSVADCFPPKCSYSYVYYLVIVTYRRWKPLGPYPPKITLTCQVLGG